MHIEQQAQGNCGVEAATHASTGISSFMLMFGRQPQTNEYAESQAYDAPAYQQQLQSKLAELQGYVL